jgi:hypothetical protein
LALLSRLVGNNALLLCIQPQGFELGRKLAIRGVVRQTPFPLPPPNPRHGGSLSFRSVPPPSIGFFSKVFPPRPASPPPWVPCGWPRPPGQRNTAGTNFEPGQSHVCSAPVSPTAQTMQLEIARALPAEQNAETSPPWPSVPATSLPSFPPHSDRGSCPGPSAAHRMLLPGAPVRAMRTRK